MRSSQLLGLLVLLIFARQSAAAEPISKDRTAKKYRDLVSQLVSPNKEPIVTPGEYGDDPAVRFPPGYDAAAQLRIRDVLQKLLDNLEEALPYVVEALDDKRYSMTLAWGEGEYTSNDSVGKVCRGIIADALEAYRDKMSFNDPPHSIFYRYPISQKWYKTRKGRTIAELQIEAIDWAIDRHKAERKEWARDRRANELSDLRKLRDSIVKTGRPAKRERSRPLPVVTSDRGRDPGN